MSLGEAGRAAGADWRFFGQGPLLPRFPPGKGRSLGMTLRMPFRPSKAPASASRPQIK